MEIGDLVRVLRGRDSGRIFLVIGHSVQRLQLVDGDLRPFKRPKSKNPRHVEQCGTVPEEMRQRLAAGHAPSDAEVRGVIAESTAQTEGGDASAEG
ncbi:MAG: KOW domain-containing RNA-binding protein [Thermaerobacter sp.]|nr:KOW domain-containing RNA-binding protein [Thermaerobacter sp.]